MTYDFSGYATRHNIKCTDGRVIKPNAFQHNDGETVPLVWQHMHNTPDNILGHAKLENREDGVYAFGKFNETPAGKNAKMLVEHGDINSLSIFANNLKQKGGDVIHGTIREVSLVLSGANPGAFIENINIQHNDGYFEENEEEAIIYSGLSLEDALEHEDKTPVDNTTEKDKTVKDIFDAMTQEQKDVVYIMLAAALEETDDDIKDDTTVKHAEGDENIMKKNIFDQTLVADDQPVLSHSQIQAIVNDAVKYGSFRDSFLAHTQSYGIEDIDILFPDARLVTPEPVLIKRDTSWVAGVLNGVKKSPFARIKSVAADITEEEARAKGYIKGKEKMEEVFPLLSRVTTPTTIYKKQKLDREDIIDIVDLDIVAWMKQEMRLMLDEEIARAILLGDGRNILSIDKISETNLRPIAHDASLYAHPVEVASNTDTPTLIETLVRSRKHYKGTGVPTFYTTDAILTDMLLVKDKIGRRIYTTVTELASALRVKEIVVVEPMEATPNLLGIMVNLQDYTLGADKGGQISMFDDFDIDFNQYKYLMETRISGALTKPKSALVITRVEGIEVTPSTPTFNTQTGVLTIPNKTGVIYKVDGVTKSAGAQSAVDKGVTIYVTAHPDNGFVFPHNTLREWVYTRDLLTEVTPDAPTFDKDTGVVTIPSKTGVIYKMDGDVVAAGAQAAIDAGETAVITAVADEGYKIKTGEAAEWTFTRPSGDVG